MPAEKLCDVFLLFLFMYVLKVANNTRSSDIISDALPLFFVSSDCIPRTRVAAKKVLRLVCEYILFL